MYSYNVVAKDGKPLSVTIFLHSPGTNQESNYVASNDHPGFMEVIEALHGYAEIDTIIDLIDMRYAIASRFEALSDSVEMDIESSILRYKGEVVHGVLVDMIVRFFQEGNDDFKPLVNMLEKIQHNPSEHSRDHLYRWLANNSFNIDKDGDIVAYKGVNSGEDNLSIHSGEAAVDGKTITGRIPNRSGTAITMPRSSVQFDPAQGCSMGLHVGTWSYASSFGAVTLKVKINPRDVVSVPTDCNDQKMRVCRYEVISVIDKRPDLLLGS